ncbi:hypothetical protein Q9189_002271 [Teloschistes chrysophthalmus]
MSSLPQDPSNTRGIQHEGSNGGANDGMMGIHSISQHLKRLDGLARRLHSTLGLDLNNRWLSRKSWSSSCRACDESYASHLRKAGYATHIAALPTFDSTDVNTSCAADTDAVRRQLLSFLEVDGSDNVVFAHSYGGIPGGGAAVGLSKSIRSQNSQKGGVLGLMYMSAFIIPEGADLSESLGGRKPPYILQDQDSLIERSGVHWHVKDVETSHSAFVSRPDEIITLLRDFFQT